MVLAACALALAACGGGDDDPETITVTTPAEAPSDDASKPTEAADKRRAEDALLVLNDFPSGWTATEDDDEDDEESACDEIREAREAVNARASSPTFGEDEDTFVEQAVYVYATEGEARAHFSEMTSDAARDCFGADVADQVGENIEGKAEVRDPTTSELRVVPVGSETAGARVTIPYESQFSDGELVLDAVFARVGRGLSLFVIYGGFGSPDDEQRDLLVGTAARRLSRVLE